MKAYINGGMNKADYDFEIVNNPPPPPSPCVRPKIKRGSMDSNFFSLFSLSSFYLIGSQSSNFQSDLSEFYLFLQLFLLSHQWLQRLVHGD